MYIVHHHYKPWKEQPTQFTSHEVMCSFTDQQKNKKSKSIKKLGHFDYNDNTYGKGGVVAVSRVEKAY